MRVTGPHNITMEFIKAPDDYGIKNITPLLHKIHDTGNIPPDISKLMYIALPKKLQNAITTAPLQ